MVETSDLEPRRSRWQALAATLVIALTLGALASLAAYRYFATRPQRSQASVIGSVTVAAGLNLRCTLPVTAYGSAAAMISLPDGTVTVDHSVPTGTQGKGIYSYDPQVKKWLPVPRSSVSADGRSYAFTTMTTGVPGQPPTGDLRVRDAAGGREHTVWKGDGNAVLIGWAGNTVYFTVQGTGGSQPPSSPEVWAVDASGSNLHRVGPNPPPAALKPGEPYSFFGGGTMGGGAIWSVRASRAPVKMTSPPAPGQPMPFAGPDTITRMDLASGAISVWYTAAEGHAVGVIGIDADGFPIATLTEPKTFATPPPPGYAPPRPTYLVLTGRNQTVPLDLPASASYLSGFASDSHGTWLSSPGQLWLFSSGRLAKVADVPERLFPPPTPPPGVVVPSGKPGVVQQGPSGPFLQVVGPCS